MNQIEEMQTYVRIVEAGSITKAAEQLGTVKSAVSRRLSDLEKRLGVDLIIRTTRSQVLTDLGQTYYQHCIRLIDDIAEVESSIRNENIALKGRIKVAAPLSFGLAHLGPALRKFNDIHPGINFEIDFNDRRIDLIEDGFDLAIRISKLEDSSLIARRLTSTRLILCASPSYLQKYGMPKVPEDLHKGHIKLHYKDQLENWITVDKSGKKRSIKIPVVLTANNAGFLCQAAIEGKGLFYMPDFVCYKFVQSGQLQPLLTDYMTDNIINAYALYPQTRHLSQKVRSLVDYLAEYFGDEPYWQID